MFKIILPFSIISSLSISLQAATNLITESFETDGEGTRYFSNSFNDSANDFWGLTDANGPNPGNLGVGNFTSPFTNIDGSQMFGGEDFDVPENPSTNNQNGYLLFNNLGIGGGNLGSFALTLSLGASTQSNSRFESNDGFLIQYAFDNDGISGSPGPNQLAGVGENYTTIGAFYGGLGTGGLGSNLFQDTNLDGAGNSDAGFLTSNLNDFTFNFTGTGNVLSIRIVAMSNTGSEDLALDNIRLVGDAVPEPSSLLLMSAVSIGLLLRRNRNCSSLI